MGLPTLADYEAAIGTKKCFGDGLPFYHQEQEKTETTQDAYQTSLQTSPTCRDEEQSP